MELSFHYCLESNSTRLFLAKIWAKAAVDTSSVGPSDPITSSGAKLAASFDRLQPECRLLTYAGLGKNGGAWMGTILVDAESASQDQREEIEELAKKVVLEAYRDACRSGARPFEAALETYRGKFPRIHKNLARHAVAHIMTTEGM